VAVAIVIACKAAGLSVGMTLATINVAMRCFLLQRADHALGEKSDGGRV
jgi:hypothetical protein